MTVRNHNKSKQSAHAAALICLLPLAACMGSGTSFLEDTGLSEPLPAPAVPEIVTAPSNDEIEQPVTEPSLPATIAIDEANTALPTGPVDTGTYPDLRNQPEVRIAEQPGEDVQALTNEMVALADAHEAGRISTDAYKRRLAYLRALAKNHSADMLAQIGEPAN